MLDKATDLLKAIDSPFKLFAVVLVGALGFGGWFLHANPQLLVPKHSMHPEIKDAKDVAAEALKLLKDAEATAVAVHKVDAATNTRLTIVAMTRDGSRNANIEGYKTTLFNSGSNKRNPANVAMLAGEVFCAPFKSSSKIGKWMDSVNVKYMCRGGIPPSGGHFHGYIALGFKEKPSDLVSIKGRITIAAAEMSKT